MHNTVSSVHEDQLHEGVHYGPVTALKFLDSSHVLVGYGPFLRLYEVEKASGFVKIVWQRRVFKRNKIHCISVTLDKSMVAVSGGRSFALVDLKTKHFVEKAINEWIVAIEFSIASELLILSSHNEVLWVTVSDGFQSLEVAQKLHCNEKSILYSGSIQRCSNGHVYVAAGTVMSGVIVWDLHSRDILHNLTDHEGSIFAVKIDTDAQYIISCSDDRSIKIFSFSEGRLLASGWGHGSRIWSLSFYKVSADEVSIFSTGEDCSARLWKYQQNNNVLKQIEYFDNAHEGKHVWSGDAASEDWQSLVTGGADGKVRLFDISGNSSSNTYTSEEIETQCSVVLEKKEVIKQFAVLPNIDGTVVMTNRGKMFLHTAVHSWSQIEIPEEYSKELKEFAILRSFESASHVVVCTRSGDLLILGFSNSSTQPTHLEFIKTSSDQKFKVINVLSWSSDDHLVLLLVGPGNSVYMAKEFNLRNQTLSFTRSHTLQNPDPRAFMPTSVFYDPLHQYLLVGSRHANFAAYYLAQNSPVVPYLMRKVCPGDTVTSISEVTSEKDQLTVLVTVRDGTYLMLNVSKINEEFKLEIIHQNKFTKGFVEGGFYEQGQCYLYGFRSGSFYVWNETFQLEISNEPCGGAHRSWGFQRGENKHSFNFLRNSSLISRTLEKLSPENGLISSGTHGREIRSLAICPRDELNGTKLFASASEDATIKVGYVSHDHEISIKWTMNSHVSGLQVVKFLSDDYFASSAANEELIIWKVSRDLPQNVAVMEVSRLPTTDENPDLRIMDIASVECTHGFFIAAGFSNSQIRVYFYDKNAKTFSLVAEETYSTFCILNVELIELGEKVLLITGTTDGFVTIWDVAQYVHKNVHAADAASKLGAPMVRQQLHQSGVKSLLVTPFGTGSVKIITGGDDNALISAMLSCAPDLSLEIDTFIENAASATITGIVHAGEDHVVVTSVDQVVRKWNYKSGLTCVAATYTTVADTGCCVSSQFGDKTFAIVGGAGLSVFIT